MDQITINEIRNELSNRLRGGPVLIKGLYWTAQDVADYANDKPKVRDAKRVADEGVFFTEYARKSAQAYYLKLWFEAYDELLSDLACALDREVARA